MARLQALSENLSTVLLGKPEVVEMVEVALLCQGHVLLEDVPGLGKTMLVKGLAKSLGCKFSRIQFTPDLLPSDVVGVTVYNQKPWIFRTGLAWPANIVLADEINRTSQAIQPPEAMEEGQLTVDGKTWPLPNPLWSWPPRTIGARGPFSPEAQLMIPALPEIGYPGPMVEEKIIRLKRRASIP